MSNRLFYAFDKDREFWLAALERAKFFKKNKISETEELQNKQVGLLFFEPSSRTRWSFEKACLNLKLDYMVSVVDQNTSHSKGERDEDTLELYLNLGFDLVVIRSKENTALQEVLKSYPHVKIINAGYGSQAHPSQAFLDYFTWTTEATSLSAKPKLLILGDIKHSRVARSHIRLSKILSYEVGLLEAPGFEVEEELKAAVVCFKDRKQALDWADLVMPLRVQKERHFEAKKWDFPPLRSKELKKDHFLLHPGPFMRNEDLEEDLIHDKKSLIFKQKENGVSCRMALISSMLKECEENKP